MTVALVLAVLALFDGSLAGFRAAAGREGRIDKRGFFRQAIARGAGWSTVVVGANAALAAALIALAPDRDAAWADFVRAGTTSTWVFGTFATLTLAALALWFLPVHEWRLLATMIVLGPLTLVRPLVITGGLAAGAIAGRDPRVAIVAASAAVSMLGLETALGRRHAGRWRRLVG